MVKNIFLNAISEIKIVKVKVNTKEKGVIERHCIPFDFWPSRKFKDGVDRYHFWDLDSPEKKHNLSILPEQLIKIEILSQSFNPWDYVKWKPTWFVKRDWWDFS